MHGIYTYIYRIVFKRNETTTKTFQHNIHNNSSHSSSLHIYVTNKTETTSGFANSNTDVQSMRARIRVQCAFMCVRVFLCRIDTSKSTVLCWMSLLVDSFVRIDTVKWCSNHINKFHSIESESVERSSQNKVFQRFLFLDLFFE